MSPRTFAVDRVPGVRFRAAAGGWFVAVDPVPASRAADVPALREIAVMVERGAMPGTTPLIVAAKQPDGGFPLVVVAVPLVDAEVTAWLQGDRSVARDVVEALEEAYREHMANARAGRAR
jgi:hypothetical protein